MEEKRCLCCNKVISEGSPGDFIYGIVVIRVCKEGEEPHKEFRYNCQQPECNEKFNKILQEEGII